MIVLYAAKVKITLCTCPEIVDNCVAVQIARLNRAYCMKSAWTELKSTIHSCACTCFFINNTQLIKECRCKHLLEMLAHLLSLHLLLAFVFAFDWSEKCILSCSPFHWLSVGISFVFLCCAKKARSDIIRASQEGKERLPELYYTRECKTTGQPQRQEQS